MGKRFYKKGDLGTLSRLAIGALICASCILLFAAVFGAIAISLEDATAKIPLFSMLTLILSAVASGIAVSRSVGGGKIVFSMLTALFTSLVFILIGIIAGGSVSWAVFLNFLIFIGVFTLAAYLFRKRERGSHKRFSV